jgi:hypothetical protein
MVGGGTAGMVAFMTGGEIGAVGEAGVGGIVPAKFADEPGTLAIVDLGWLASALPVGFWLAASP